MKSLVASLMAALLAGTAAASSLPRLKLQPGVTKAQAIKQLNRKINRTAGFSRADCWLYDGNARIGWRHGACVGTYTYSGSTSRFKLTVTPISCSRLRQVVVVPGEKTQTSIVRWRHETFVC